MIYYTENKLADLIAENQKNICTSYDCLVPKCYTSHDNECDVFAIRKSGLCDEFEIKISRADFLSDVNKKIAVRQFKYTHSDNETEDMKHHMLQSTLGYEKWKKILAPWEKMKYQALVDGDTPVNYFWYVVKHDIIHASEVPSWAGLIKVFDNGKLNIVKTPEKLHENKVDDSFKFQIVRKLGYRYWNQRLSIT